MDNMEKMAVSMMMKQAFFTRPIRDAIRAVGVRPQGMGRTKAVLRSLLTAGGMPNEKLRAGDAIGAAMVGAGAVTPMIPFGNWARFNRGIRSAKRAALAQGLSPAKAVWKNALTGGGMPGKWTKGDTLGVLGATALPLAALGYIINNPQNVNPGDLFTRMATGNENIVNITGDGTREGYYGWE